MPPGLRKSGMPDSVLMPAPVNTTARFASASIRFRPATPLSFAMPATLAKAPTASKKAGSEARQSAQGQFGDPAGHLVEVAAQLLQPERQAEDPLDLGLGQPRGDPIAAQPGERLGIGLVGLAHRPLRRHHAA